MIVACTIEGFPPLEWRDLPPTMVPVYTLVSLSQKRCTNQQRSSNVTYPYSSMCMAYLGKPWRGSWMSFLLTP